MKLLVEPIYGWGWTDQRGQSVEVPRPFELEISTMNGSAAFSAGVGRLDDKCEHPLSGLWIRLSQRHTMIDGNYNLVATDVEQSLNESATEPLTSIKVMGFAVARRI